MSVSTHVLDTASGRPAGGVGVRLQYRAGDDWQPVADGVTDADGRLRLWDGATAVGVHRLVFDTAAHSSFYPQVCVSFAIAHPEEHHHVPLLLSPFAYSTYRGS